MPLFVVIGTDGPEGLARRPSVRPRHLEHLRPLDRAGRVVVAGPLFGADGTTPRGSLIVLEAATARIETRLQEEFDREVESSVIGNLVMEELQKLNQVAYVRFASVYREFKDVSQFLDELKPILESRQSGA